jgi:hypothetical protein
LLHTYKYYGKEGYFKWAMKYIKSR